MKPNQKPKVDKYKRKSIVTDLKPFCVFADKNDYVEVCEWINGEGFDVEVSGKLHQRFQMTYGEFEALKKVVKKMMKYGD